MTKRLIKGKNKCIDGICCGIADYFNCDPTIIRIIWLVFMFCGFCGVGIILYLIGIIIIPDE